MICPNQNNPKEAWQIVENVLLPVTRSTGRMLQNFFDKNTEHLHPVTHCHNAGK